MRIALVGLDSIYWPTAFADALSKAANGGSLTAICDLGRTDDAVKSQIGVTAGDFAERRGALLVHSVEDAAAAADACLVCTRHTRMPAVITRLLALGKPVFAAKPVALSSASGLPCAAGMTARSSAVIRTASRLLAARTIGDVLSVRVSHQHGRLADWPPEWWYVDPAEGDPFCWLGWYAIDGVVALTGSRVAAITGAAHRHLAPYPMPDLIRGTARLDDGRIATLEIHFTVGDWGLASFEVEVVGARGLLRAAGPSSGITLLADGGPRTIPFDEIEDPLAGELAAWLRAVEGEGTPVLSLEEAAHIVAVSEAWQRSAREERWIEVALP
jgi:predicted dehydrogenase